MSHHSTASMIETTDEIERARQDFADCLAVGLARQHKSIPSRFLYDARGSQLFEQITKLPEYYPTRTERWILETYGQAMSYATPAGSVLIEFGSGSSLKTEILLRHLDKLAAYVAIDISSDALMDASTRLGHAFPRLQVIPITADFSKPVVLPGEINERHKLGFFPGSTIGNFLPLQAICLLSNMKRTLGPKSRLIIGVDLKKDETTLLRAYNDNAGVTAEFNLNLLARANRELGADFDVSAFEHKAVYDDTNGRIDMYLISRKSQTVKINGNQYHFLRHERLHTEYSHKYDEKEFADLARQAGWTIRIVWTDVDKLFSVFELVS